MKIVKILGGLGNQMFQYAFYRSLKSKFINVKVDISDFKTYTLHNSYELKRVFNIEVDHSNFWENIFIGGINRDFLSKGLKKIFGVRSTYYEQLNASCFDPDIYENVEDAYLDGYWQNEKYFKGVVREIRNDFTFPELTESRDISLLDKMKNEASVAIHIRRGDYLGHPLLGNICDANYYSRAIRHFNERFEKVSYFIFSNDPGWCRESLSFKNNTTFVDWNTDYMSFRDMQLMSQCSHNIVANSSFSWWAAWLNNNIKKQVICPQYWFNPSVDLTGKASDDIIPKEWTRV